MSAVTFKAEGHRYVTPTGRELDSVSKILDQFYDWSTINPDVLKLAADRGTAVHRACHLWDTDDLDEESLDPVIVPYLNAWKKYTAENKPDWTEIERPFAHEALGYAGTPDRFGVVHGRWGVRDIKTGTVMHPAIGLQLTGYELNAQHEHPDLKIETREAIQLRKDGTYKIHVYPFEMAAFVSALTVHNWKKKHGQLG